MRAIGLKGYSQLKVELVATLQDMVSPVDKLRNEMAHRPSGEFGLTEQLQIATSNLSTTNTNNPSEVFEAFVSALIQARKIYILGFGNSAYMAGLAASNLIPFIADAQAINMEASVLAITDSPASPLANIEHHALFAAANHPVLISSNSAVLALIEGLVAAVMTRNKEAVRLSAELTESVLKLEEKTT